MDNCKWKIESTDFDSNSGPYGGYRCRTSEGLPSWLDRSAREVGWDPAHLSVRITADIDEWHETLEDQIRNMSFDLVEARGVERYRGWGEMVYSHRDTNRPEPHSVLVDLSGPWRWSAFHWLTCSDKLWGKPTGMSKSVSLQWEHERRVFHAKAMAEYAQKVLDDIIQNYCVTAEILWRGEVVGESALGGFEMEYHGPFDAGPSFEAQLLEAATDLLPGAWDEAESWAEAAVADAQSQAAEIIESIVLLPGAAHQVVRDEFDRKVISMNAKKEA